MDLKDFLEKEPGSSEKVREPKESSRELYSEEKEIIDEFEMRIQRQNKNLENLADQVRQLKISAEDIGAQIKGINIPIKKIIPKTVIIIDDVKTKKNSVNDLIKEIRKPSKICCDLFLLFILLGLISVLISIIRH